MFWRVAGRPVRRRWDLEAQRRRTMSRCQRRIVSGATSSRSPRRRAFGITLSKAASRARSAQFRCGRRGCRRCSTASWRRSIKISAVCHASARRDSRSHVVTRAMRRNANRGHMTGDRDGQAAGKANPAGQSRGRDSRHAQVEPVAEVSAAGRGGRAGPQGRYGIDGGFAALAVFGVIEAGLAGTVAWAVRHRWPAIAALAAVGGAAVSGVGGELPVLHRAGQAGDLGAAAG